MNIKKMWRERTDPTGKRLFFQLLHYARMGKLLGVPVVNRKCQLIGMVQIIEENREDFTIADNIRGLWTCQQSGAD